MGNQKSLFSATIREMALLQLCVCYGLFVFVFFPFVKQKANGLEIRAASPAKYLVTHGLLCAQSSLNNLSLKYFAVT